MHPKRSATHLQDVPSFHGLHPGSSHSPKIQHELSNSTNAYPTIVLYNPFSLFSHKIICKVVCKLANAVLQFHALQMFGHKSTKAYQGNNPTPVRNPIVEDHRRNFGEFLNVVFILYRQPLQHSWEREKRLLNIQENIWKNTFPVMVATKPGTTHDQNLFSLFKVNL